MSVKIPTRDSLESFLKCDLKKREHLIRQPRRLPCCNRTACLQCIQELAVLTTGDNFNSLASLVFQCPCCRRKNTIKEQTLQRNMMLEHKLDDNLSELSLYLSARLNSGQSGIVNLLDGRKSTVDNLFEFIKDDLTIRVESIKLSLDQLELKLHSKVDEFKSNLRVGKSLLVDQLPKSNCESYGKKLNSLEHLLRLHKSISDRGQLLYGIDKTKNMIEAGRHVGHLETPMPRRFYLDAKNGKPSPSIELIKLPFHAKYFCEYSNGAFLFSDTVGNLLMVFSKSFKLMRKIEHSGGLTIKRPGAVCYDRRRNRVYLVSQGIAKAVLSVLDGSLNRVLDQLELDDELGEGSDLILQEDNLYYLKSNTTSVLCISLVQGPHAELLSAKQTIINLGEAPFKIYHSRYINCSSMSATSLLAVSISKKYVFIYDLASPNVPVAVLMPIKDIFTADLQPDKNQLNWEDSSSGEVNSIYLEQDSSCLYVQINDGFGKSNSRLICYRSLDSKGRSWTLDKRFQFSLKSDQLVNRLIDLNDLIKASLQMRLVDERLYLSLAGQYLLRV